MPAVAAASRPPTGRSARTWYLSSTANRCIRNVIIALLLFFRSQPDYNLESDANEPLCNTSESGSRRAHRNAVPRDSPYDSDAACDRRSVHCLHRNRLVFNSVLNVPSTDHGPRICRRGIYSFPRTAEAAARLSARMFIQQIQRLAERWAGTPERHHMTHNT